MIGSTFYNWQTHRPTPDANFNRCSPNLVVLGTELGSRWSMTNNGCYGVRPIRGGSAPSSHSYGAAIDRTYNTIGRARVVAEVLPWLINHSAELHIDAIHDYLAARIWHAGRTTDIGDAHTQWWATQPRSTVTGMGQSWATYLHIETTRDGWADNTPTANRMTSVPTPQPTLGGFMVHTTLHKGSTGPEVWGLQIVLHKLAGQINVIADGVFAIVTDTAVRNIQAWTGLVVDGVVGPKTWAVIDALVNA